MLQVLIAGCLTFGQHVRTALHTFCQRSEVIGTRYLVQPNVHCSERIFWAVVLLAAYFGTLYSVFCFAANYESTMFQVIVEDQPEFEIFDFPSIGVCESGPGIGTKKMQRVLSGLRGKYQHISYDENFEALLNALTYPGYHKHFNQTFSKFLNSSLEADTLRFYDELNYKELARELRNNCSELFYECEWQNKKFDCCEYFRPISGLKQSCFVINSQHNEGNFKLLDMKIEKYTPNLSMELLLNAEIRVFALDQLDVPEKAAPLATSPTVPLGFQFFLGLKVIVNYNDPELYNFSPRVIQCWPPNYHLKEPFATYKHASYTACLSDCLRLLQWRTCGCIKHTLNEGVGTSKAPFCNITGYACLEQHRIYVISSMESLPESMCSYCLPACKKNTIDIVDTNFYSFPEKQRAKVTITSSEFPPLRTRRQVIRNYMDIAVLLGGIISLFVGFSLVHSIDLLHCIVCALIT